MQVRIVLFAIAILLGGAAIYLWNKGGGTVADWVEPGHAATSERLPPAGTEKDPTQAGTGPGIPSREDKPAGSSSVRVSVTPVHRGEVPVYLSGLGTVQGYYTVNIKAQVDGVILKMPFAEGQDVKEGDTLVLIDPQTYQAKLETAQAEKQRASIQRENAKANLWRDQELLKHDFSTQKQTDQEQMLVGQYTADIAQYDADIKYWQAEVDYTNIRSPINGRIGVRKIDPGNLIRAQDNATIVTVIQLQPISVIITVPAKELARNNISLGTADLEVTAYAENGITALDRGKVHTVNNTVDQTTGTIQLKASFDNRRYKLWPGDFVDCRILVNKVTDGLTVPTASIHQGPKGDFVWLINPDNTASVRGVRVRQSLGGTSLVEGNLQGGDNVVLDGYPRLQIGSRVEITQQATDVGSRASAAE
jgi:multidrug efflux system membrane fusion protein